MGANIAFLRATIGTTATLIAAARTETRRLTIRNLGTTPVFIGDSGVTIASGMLLDGSVGATLEVSNTVAIYGVTEAISQDVSAIDEWG